MSTTASVAQFMAILSGGVNPALLRQGNGSGVSLNADTKAENNFHNFIHSDSTANNLVTLESLGLSQDILEKIKAGTIENGLISNLPAGVLEKIKAGTLNASDKIALNLPQNVIDKLTTLTTTNSSLSDNQKLEASPIWQFIRQQANTDLSNGNLLVISLSEKGLPQDVIDGLQDLFGEGDLITILRDPKLNAQLDNALSDINIDLQDIQTAQIAPVINAILTQNKGKIENTIQFNVNEAKLTQAGIEQLLDNPENYLIQESGFKLVPTQPVSTLVPVQQTLVQFQSGDMDDALAVLQTLTPSQQSKPNGKEGIAKLNPFSKPSDDSADVAPLVAQTNSGDARLVAQNQNASTNQSTARALENAANKNVAGADYSSSALSSDIFSLSSDGKYTVPFEASFKTASQAANPLLSTPQSSQPHPATQALALSMTKMAGMKNADGMDNSQKYRLQLDPPEMGRLDIEMDILGGTSKKVKAVILVEKPETLGLMQRDLHALVKAMQNAGFDNITSNDISFSLSDNGTLSDNAKDHSSNQNNSGKNSQSVGTEDLQSPIETQMTIIIDPVTGQKQVNMLV